VAAFERAGKAPVIGSAGLAVESTLGRTLSWFPQISDTAKAQGSGKLLVPEPAGRQEAVDGRDREGVRLEDDRVAIPGTLVLPHRWADGRVRRRYRAASG
jgi:hypothetical protein